MQKYVFMVSNNNDVLSWCRSHIRRSMMRKLSILLHLRSRTTKKDDHSPQPPPGPSRNSVPDLGSKILAPTAADATCFVPDWEFNILEFGAHVGDGTLRLLTSIMRSEAVMPSALNVISTEDNESWQVEGTKLVRKALKFAEEKYLNLNILFCYSVMLMGAWALPQICSRVLSRSFRAKNSLHVVR